MKGTTTLLLCAVVALSNGVELNNKNCLNEATKNILLPHNICKNFYQCDDGKYIIRKCPSDLVFDIDAQICDWPEKVNCKSRGIEEATGSSEINDENNANNNDNPSEAPLICAAVGSDGVLIAHENCNQFYKCSKGKPEVFWCPSNLFYNFATEQCDWPENVKCNGNIAVPGKDEEISDSANEDNNGNSNGGGNSNPGEAGAICAADGSDGVLIAHENCNQFYKCSKGKPEVFWCPSNLFYNFATEQCDWPENVKCNGNIAVPGKDEEISDSANEDNNGNSNGGGNSNPGEAGAICAADGSDGVLIAHENCNQFYKCSKGKPEIFWCPSNLFYNFATEQCDWPENVKCNGNIAVPGKDEEISDSANEDNDGNTNGGGNSNPGEAGAICAADGSDGVLIAHENCNQFYKCSKGKPEVFWCPSNLFYNFATEQCDWPENVKCNGNIAVPGKDEEISDSANEDNNGNSNGGGNSNPGEAGAICAADGSDGVLIAHENCNQFYKCSKGKPEIFWCPSNLFYNFATEQCDWPENVKCNGNIAVPGKDEEISDSANEDNDGNTNGGGNSNPGEAGAICAADGSDGVLIAHENCNQFYKCSKGKPEVFWCPSNLFYNFATEQCDWPENVKCNGNIAVPGKDEEISDSANEDNNGNSNGGGNSNPGEAGAICAADGSDGVLIAHENCNQFYKCSKGKPEVFWCPSNLFYNFATEQCDWPENVKCNGNIAVPGKDEEISDSANEDNDGNTNGGGNSNPGEAGATCAADGSDGVLIAHENCNQFYKCSKGKPEVFWCPSNLFYNFATEQCDWPENVKCNGNIAVPGKDEEISDSANEDNDGNTNGDGNSNPGEAGAICAADGSDGVLIAHENCNQFYKCSKGKPEVFWCPSNLFYNFATEQCDWPENVKCNGNIAVPGKDEEISDSANEDNDGNTNGGGNSNPGEAGAICAADGSDGVLIAHENCNQFYKCSKGKPEVFWCPSNLFYNFATEQCDWPENVKCNGNIAVPGKDEEISDSANEDNDGNTNGGGNSNPGEAGAICAADGSDGVLIAHENCNQFYKCSKGKPEVFWCPSNLFYNFATEQCDWPENVKCNGNIAVPGKDEEISDSANEDNNGNSNGGGNSNPGEAGAICAADGSDGVLIAHENCNQFYKCSKGKPEVFWCPSNLFYNFATEQCDWPENVKCNGNIAVPGKDEEISDSANEDNNGNSNGGGNSNPGEAGAICAADGSDGVLIAHENCNQFYKCSKGKPEVFWCPSNLFYNFATEQCDWPENVKCNGNIAPMPVPDPDNDDQNNNDGGSSSPSEVVIICAFDGSDGTLLAHKNCNQFYTCLEGKPVILTCPLNLLYNSSTKQCDWPGNVQCL